MIKEVFDITNGFHTSSGKLSISSINGCRRKKYLELKGLHKETYDAKSMRAFALGDLFHQQAAKEILEKGEKVGLHLVAGEVDIPEQKYISGRADQIISISATGELIIVDIKSAGDWTLDKAKKGEVDSSYINQIQLYLHFFKLQRGFIVFFGKHKGEVHEVEVKYDKELCERLIAEVEDFFINYVEKDIEPPLCDGGSWGCSVCGKKGKGFD